MIGTELDYIFGDVGFVSDAESQAEWREQKAAEYPDDARNRTAADALRALVRWANDNPTAPTLLRLNEALRRLYEGGSSISLSPSVTERLGRMGFGETASPIHFVQGLAEAVEQFLADATDDGE